MTDKKTNQPLGGNQMPRFAGIPSLFRLPVQNNAEGLDIALLGIPLDIGTSNRSGTPPRRPRVVARVVKTNSKDAVNDSAAPVLPHVNNAALP